MYEENILWIWEFTFENKRRNVINECFSKIEGYVNTHSLSMKSKRSSIVLALAVPNSGERKYEAVYRCIASLILIIHS